MWLFCVVYLCFSFPRQHLIQWFAQLNTLKHCRNNSVYTSVSVYVYTWGNKKEGAREKARKSCLPSREQLDTRLFVHYHHILAMKKVSSEFSVYSFHFTSFHQNFTSLTLLNRYKTIMFLHIHTYT